MPALHEESARPVSKDEDSRSVARQVTQARAVAAHKGWVVAEEHVYVDDGISGAEFGGGS
jgi:hypothetical protein